MTEQQFKILVKMQATVERMDKELFGNGQPGRLKELEQAISAVDARVDDHDKSRSYIKGAGAAILGLVSLFGGTEIYHLFFGRGK